MIRNYLQIAWRSLLKNRLTTLVNIGGLILGLSGALLIGLFILDELAYDQHYRNKDRLYRLISTFEKDGTIYQSAQTNGNIASRLVLGFPEVQHATRLMPSDEAFLFSKETAFKEAIIYTDSFFIKVFDIPLLLGDKDKCLIRPSSLLISETTAIKLFGNNWKQKTILGETLAVDGRIPLTITGVFNDFPEHSHFKSNLFASVPSGFEDWISDKSKVYTYVLLGEYANVDNLEQKIRSLSYKFNQAEDDGNRQISLQSITRIHLYSSFEDDNAILGSVKNIYALLLVALFLVIITVTNFVNLYTASSFNRLKEVGIRKTLGALSFQLRHQFLLETALITVIAAGFALITVFSFLPTFNNLTGKSLTPETLLDANVIYFIIGLTVTISLLAGFYPSIYLSGTKTIEALKGVKNRTSRIIGLRKGLVILQFSISCIMIILSIVAYKQVDLINKKSLGFDKENIVVIANLYMLGSTENIIAFKNELLTVPGVEDVSITGYTPSQNRWGNQKVTFPRRDEHSNYAQPANWLTVDEGFIKTMGLNLIAGRNFLKNHEHDRDAIVINEKAVHQFQLNANGKSPIGSELSFKDAGEHTYQNFTVVGIVNDFNFGSLHDSVKPLVMKVGYHRFEIALRLSAKSSKKEAISKIEAIWKKKLPIIPFEYSFIKDRFDWLHRSDIATSKIFSAFCLVIIIISAFGLFSIVTYTIANRTKEIGIRKLLGASDRSIVFLLASGFTKVIILSYALALPLGWVLTQKWLEDFAYKTEISWWVFTFTGIILLFIAALTLVYQAIKASSANPIDNLRYE